MTLAKCSSGKTGNRNKNRHFKNAQHFGRATIFTRKSFSSYKRGSNSTSPLLRRELVVWRFFDIIKFSNELLWRIVVVRVRLTWLITDLNRNGSQFRLIYNTNTPLYFRCARQLTTNFMAFLVFRSRFGDLRIYVWTFPILYGVGIYGDGFSSARPSIFKLIADLIICSSQLQPN